MCREVSEMKSRKNQIAENILFMNLVIFLTICIGTSYSDDATTVQTILEKVKIDGGIIIHVGCGDGQLTSELAQADNVIIHGIDRDNQSIQQARQTIFTKNLYGKVSVDSLSSDTLPYIDNLANLVVVTEPTLVSNDEIMRVLCPNGVALIQKNGNWKKVIKPRPEEIDDWTHYLHDESGNPVAHDTVVGPPRHLQWVAGPRWARHHDHMSSISALVSAKGRVFYIADEGSTASIELPAEWRLVARDGFNGKILWKKNIDEWHPHLWPLKSGPAQLPRRLVAIEDKVYVTLGIQSPISQLCALTGTKIKEYEGTEKTEEFIVSNGVIYAVVNPEFQNPQYKKITEIRTKSRQNVLDGKPRKIMAINAESGEFLWSKESQFLPVTLIADQNHIYFHNSDTIVCLDRNTGEQVWNSESMPYGKTMMSYYAPTLIVYKEVLLFSGGETASHQTGGWYTQGVDTMTALSTNDGKTLWSANHPPSGYRSPEDILVVDNLVWTGETTSGRVSRAFPWTKSEDRAGRT
jgi:outer membrane protein assembly factor BamB